MIIVLRPDTEIESAEAKAVLDFLAARPGIIPQVHSVTGTGRVLTEIYAVGDTDLLDPQEVASLPSVERVVRVSRDYRIIGRHADDDAKRGQEAAQLVPVDRAEGEDDGGAQHYAPAPASTRSTSPSLKWTMVRAKAAMSGSCVTISTVMPICFLMSSTQ